MTMSAISSYSDWMSQLPVELYNIPLFNLTIPGKQRKLYLLILLLYGNNTHHLSIDCKFVQIVSNPNILCVGRNQIKTDQIKIKCFIVTRFTFELLSYPNLLLA